MHCVIYTVLYALNCVLTLKLITSVTRGESEGEEK